jgi:RNA polymerase sigma-70 factor (ECF subfamily)
MLVLIISDVDNKTVERYYLEMNDDLIKVAYSILQDHFDAETAVQDAFVKIMDSIELFRKVPDKKKTGYCYMVVKNVSLNMYNKGKRSNMQIIMLEDSFFEPEDENADVESIIEAEEEVAMLKLLINRLDDSLKQALMLRYAHGLTYKQISNILHISEALARKRVERAIGKLSELSKEGGCIHE